MMQELNDDVEKILKFFKRNKKKLSPLTILTHNYPDPDALASAFALHYLANKVYGINAHIIYQGVIGRVENRAMVDILKIPAVRVENIVINKEDKVALVDTQPGFKNNPFPKNCRAQLVIDQHPPAAVPESELAVISSEIGATSVILAQCLIQSGTSIPSNIATALAYGILSDTMNFFRCNNRSVVDTYLKILPKGDLALLAKIQNPQRNKEYFSTLGKTLQNCRVYQDSLVVHLGNVETPDMVAQAADFLLTYDQAIWSLCTARYEGKLYVSLRSSQSEIPAYEVLRKIVPFKNQAGGHDFIAGGSFEVKKVSHRIQWAEAEKELVRKFRKTLKTEKAKMIKDPFLLSKKRK